MMMMKKIRRCLKKADDVVIDENALPNVDATINVSARINADVKPSSK
jgi:hypothetical protein